MPRPQRAEQFDPAEISIVHFVQRFARWMALSAPHCPPALSALAMTGCVAKVELSGVTHAPNQPPFLFSIDPQTGIFEGESSAFVGRSIWCESAILILV